MVIIKLIVQITVALSVTNTFLSLFFYKKHRNNLSRNYFYLVLIGFFNLFFLGFVFFLFEEVFVGIEGFEYLYNIGLMITVATVFLMIAALRNLFLWAIEKAEKDWTRLGPIALVISTILLILFIFIRDQNLLFKILWFIMLFSGILHIVNYLDLLIRFIRKYSDIESFAIRKSTLAIMIAAGIYLPLQYFIFTVYFFCFGWSVDLVTFLLARIHNTSIIENIMHYFPVMYHLMFHSISIFYIARYYFKEAHPDPPQETITMDQSLAYNLSRREVEVANLLLKGLNNRHIRERLFIADGTLRNHISSLYQKTGTANREDFVLLFKKSSQS